MNILKASLITLSVFRVHLDFLLKVHSSVTEVYNSDDPVNIQKCLESFTREEQLAEDELYYCSKCKQHRMATKKLEIWRLPPVLVRINSTTASCIIDIENLLVLLRLMQLI